MRERYGSNCGLQFSRIPCPGRLEAPIAGSEDPAGEEEVGNGVRQDGVAHAAAAAPGCGEQHSGEYADRPAAAMQQSEDEGGEQEREPGEPAGTVWDTVYRAGYRKRQTPVAKTQPASSDYLLLAAQ